MSLKVNKEALVAAYEAVRDDSQDVNWAVFKYQDKTIDEDSRGSEFDEFRSKFADDECGFGYLRVTSGDELSQRAKFVLITWVGQTVSALKRGKMSTDKGAVKEVLTNSAVDLLFDGDEEFTIEHIRERVKKAGGANYGTGNGAE